MAGSLIKVDEEIVTSAVASVTLTGIDSTYDVYMVAFNSVKPDTDAVGLYTRVTTSGTADTTANYDFAHKELRANTAFANGYNTNQTQFIPAGTGTDTVGEMLNGIIYCFNFNNASEYSFVTYETTYMQQTPQHYGRQGSAVHTVAQACDGINFSFASGNIHSGTFKLYGLKK